MVIASAYNWDFVFTVLILLFLVGCGIFAVFMYGLFRARHKTWFKVFLGLLAVPVVIASILVVVRFVLIFFG